MKHLNQWETRIIDLIDFQVDKIDNRLKDVLDLRVTILLDYLRGTRDERLEKSSTTLLKRIADRSTVRFFLKLKSDI